MKPTLRRAAVTSLLVSTATALAFAQSAPNAGARPPVVAQPTPPVQSAPVLPPPPPPPQASPFAGVWRFAGGDAERRAFEAAVQRAVQGMGWIIEGMAAGRIRDSSPIPDTITIRVQNNQIEYIGVRGRLIRSPADGTTIQTTNAQGEPISLSTRINGNQMVRNGSRSEGTRREVLTVNGNTLVIEGTVSASRLPRPLVYRLTFRR